MTLFTKIIEREISADIVYEDDQCLAFWDINPQAPTHLLLIPKREIPSLSEAKPSDQELIGYMMMKAAEIALAQGLQKGYRIVINNGPYGGQTVAHLHLHILGGRALGWPPC